MELSFYMPSRVIFGTGAAQECAWRFAALGKRCLIVDDVISTGESLKALEGLLEQTGAEIVGKMAVLAEGDAIGRHDITYLAPLPLFDNEGNPID